MARPIKEGLDYFALDCQMDEKIDILEAHHGLQGFAVYIKFLQKIYPSKGGRYQYRFPSGITQAKVLGKLWNISPETIEELVKFMVEVGLFDSRIYNRYGQLTSSGIRKRIGFVLDCRQKERYKKRKEEFSQGKNQGKTGEREKERKKEIEREKEEAILKIPDDLQQDREAIIRWLNYKSGTKHWYKPTGINSLWSWIRKIKQPRRAQAIDHSIDKKWRGIFEDHGAVVEENKKMVDDIISKLVPGTKI